MFHPIIMEELAHRRHAELLAEAEKYHLIAQAEQARKADRASAGQRPLRHGLGRVAKSARMVLSVMLNILKVGLPTVLIVLGLVL